MEAGGSGGVVLMIPYLSTDRVTLHHAKAEEVYPHLEPGFTLAVLDGPYGLSIADWDRMGVDGLADWYRPHLEAVTGLMAPSASMYLWNTAEGWARLDPVVRGMGWRFRTLIVWDHVITPSILGWRSLRSWGHRHEVCGFYKRGEPTFNPTQETVNNVWPFDISNALRKERLYDGKKPDRNGLWESRDPVHPSQKPLLFADRIIRASSRPGDRVLVPFGGTCREAVACHRMSVEDVRSCVSIEPDRRYLDAVRGCFTLDLAPKQPGQVGLFEATP